MHVGGGLLPHVYCRKIVLERWDNPETAYSPHSLRVTLRFEVLEQVNKLLESQWLNDLGEGNLASSILDHLYIQPVVYKTSDDIARLRASHDPLGDPEFGESNIYLAQSKGDGHLPRGQMKGEWTGKDGMLAKNEGHFYPSPVPYEEVGFAGAYVPIKVSTSSLLGDLTKADVLSAGKEGKIRTEFKDGKEYYVIPFSWSLQFDPDIENKYNGQYNHLGIAFYTFLHTPAWMMHNGFWQQEYDDFFEQYVFEGPVNTEIIFSGGKVQDTREVFMRPGGKVWEGSVHLHATGDNPAPDGYAGDGGFGPNRGWMVGAEHKPGTDQPRLELATMANHKIEDFRFTLKPEPLSSMIGFGATPGGYNPEHGVSKIPTEGFGPNYKNLFSLQNNFLSPFQKETRKYLQKIGGDPYTGNGAHSLFDNDNEYSKLYVCRDVGNNARGLFFINFQNLLENNSYLYPTLTARLGKDPAAVPVPLSQAFKDEILSHSKILELRLYRDRVKEHTINTYEKFANDEFYEEPSQLVGTISDATGYNSPIQSPELAELSLGGLNGDSFANRFFMFSDTFPGSHSAGKYQYRIELDFKDGTYHFLYKLLRDLQHAKINLESYYDLAVSGFTKDGLNVEYSAGYVGDLKHPDSYLKSNFKTYFDSTYGTFRDPEFVDAAYKQFEGAEYFPWIEAPPLITKMQQIFGIFPSFSENEAHVQAMIDPVDGSPRGIQFFTRLLSTSIKKIEKLIGTTRINKKSDLNKVTLGSDAGVAYNLKNHFDYDISSSESTIYEHHTFDHPNEIFESVQNESIYVDYLSVGVPLSENFYGLRSLSPEYFDKRCRLDTLKFSEAVLTDFNGEYGVATQGNFLPGNIAMFKQQGNNVVYDTEINADKHDSLKQQAYSFLTPSIVTLSNVSNGAQSYNFNHSSFSQIAMTFAYGASNVMPGITTALHEDFNKWLNYEKVLAALAAYKLSVMTKGSFDLSDAYYDNQYSQVADPLAFETKEVYKRYFDSISMTIHFPNTYNNFYKTEAVPAQFTIEIDPNAPWDLEKDYPDGLLQSSEYFKSLTQSNKQNIIKIPVGSQSPGALSMTSYSEALPNSFKIYWVHKNREQYGEVDQTNSIMQTAFKNASKYRPFFFVHMNMTSRIEVFRGTLFPKKDDKAWSLLTLQDLALNNGEKLFCRIRYYQEKFLQGIQECLPVLDKYFLIYPSANPGIPPYTPHPIPTEPERTYEVPGPREWESRNRTKIAEYRETTEKGMSDRPGPRDMPPYRDIYGPDPVPTDRPATTPSGRDPGGTARSTAAGGRQEARRAMTAGASRTATGAGVQAETPATTTIAGIDVITPAAAEGVTIQTGGGGGDIEGNY